MEGMVTHQWVGIFMLYDILMGKISTTTMQLHYCQEKVF
jgi:hypothetical protein